MILVSHTPSAQERTWRKLLGYTAGQPEFRERLELSARRILTVKLAYLKSGGPGKQQPPDTSVQPIPSPSAWEFFQQSALRSVTVIRDGEFPLDYSADRRILLVGQFEEFLQEGRQRYPQADTLLFPYSPFYFARREDLERVPRTASGYEVVVFCLANYNSLEVLETLRGFTGTLVVLSTLSPVYLRETPWVQTSLAVYGTGEESFRAGFAALAGDFEPEGRIPVDFIDGHPVDGLPP
jgi:beta-N-acetylhexosaminidase